MSQPSDASHSSRAKELYVAAFVLRLALGIGLLSAVADRFGLWGPPGKPMVAWGTFPAFLAYTAQLNPWIPAQLIPALGWAVTAAETTLGFALLAGYRLRTIAADGSPHSSFRDRNDRHVGHPGAAQLLGLSFRRRRVSTLMHPKGCAVPPASRTSI